MSQQFIDCVCKCGHLEVGQHSDYAQMSCLVCDCGSFQCANHFQDYPHATNSKLYAFEVARTSPPTSTKTEALLFCGLGLTGESGEVADLIKKWQFHGHPLDDEKLLLELGDVLWYVNRAALAIGKTLEDVMQANVDKLRKRYPNGFSTEASINRKE